MMEVCFCKKKTAYEMRISDWSSDVCSSDLAWHRQRQQYLDQYLQARSAVDQRALLQLIGDRAEIAHQQPGAERDEEGRVGEDERQAGIEDTIGEHHGGKRDEDRKSTRLTSSHSCASRMPSSACRTKRTKT